MTTTMCWKGDVRWHKSYLLWCTELGWWHDAMLVFGNVDKSDNEKDIRMYMTLYNRKNGSHKSIEWNEQINKLRYYGSSQKACWWVCCVYSRVNYFILLLLVVLWWINQSIVELITFTNLLYLNSNSIRKLYNNSYALTHSGTYIHVNMFIYTCTRTHLYILYVCTFVHMYMMYMYICTVA